MSAGTLVADWTKEALMSNQHVERSLTTHIQRLFWIGVHSLTLFFVLSALSGYLGGVTGANAERPSAPIVVVKSDVLFPRHGDAPDPNEILSLVNSKRTEQGLAVLVPDSVLSALAEERAQDMVANSYYAHKNQSGKIFYDLLVARGSEPQFACENLSLEPSNQLNSSVDSWLKSSKGHRECMLDSGINKAGYASIKLYDVYINGSIRSLYVVVAIHST
jgi:hypothetical protein